MVGYTRDDLVSGRAALDGADAAEWRDADEQAIGRDDSRPEPASRFEKEYFRKDGSRVPVLLGAATFEGPPGRGRRLRARSDRAQAGAEERRCAKRRRSSRT